MKLSVLQHTWRLGSLGAASRARKELLERAARLAGTPHNQAVALASLMRRCQPVVERFGLVGLEKLLDEANK